MLQPFDLLKTYIPSTSYKVNFHYEDFFITIHLLPLIFFIPFRFKLFKHVLKKSHLLAIH